MYESGISIFLLQVVCFVVPLLTLAWVGVFPSRRLFFFMGVMTLLSLFILVEKDAGHQGMDSRVFWTIFGLDMFLLLVAMIDLLTVPLARGFSVKRKMSPVASLRKRLQVELTVENRSWQAYWVTVRDDADQELLPVDDAGRILYEECQTQERILPGTRFTWTYSLRPRSRGLFAFNWIFLRFSSLLGLWVRHCKLECAAELRVYPDMLQLAEYDLLARTNRLHLLGVRKTRRIGQDNDFERLRDYTIDDDHRRIDWRATARRDKLTVKDFQTTQNQNVVFLLDCGRMMAHSETVLAPEDFTEHHIKAAPGAVNSMLMLAWVALKQGDSVGLLCFSDKIHSFTPPKSGMRQLNGLLHASFDRFPQPVGSRYDLAFQYLATRVRRRTLVILLTNVVDEATTALVSRYLTNLHGKHLPMLALLRDHQLFDPLDTLMADNPVLQEKAEDGRPMRNRYPQCEEMLAYFEMGTPVNVPPGQNPTDAVYTAAAAADIIRRRQEQLAALRARGVLLVDAFPEEITGQLVSRYLEIKARHLL